MQYQIFPGDFGENEPLKFSARSTVQVAHDSNAVRCQKLNSKKCSKEYRDVFRVEKESKE